MALGGRPKEQGGHKPLKISVDKFVAQGLEKVGNKSQFLESVARPVLEKMDPGEASVFLWQIDTYLSRGIVVAAKQGNFSQVQALGWLANQLEDARNLCGIPPLEMKLQKNQEASKEFLLGFYEIVFNDFRNRRYIRACKGLSVLTKMHPRLKQIASENKPFHMMTYEEFDEALGKVGYVLQSLA